MNADGLPKRHFIKGKRKLVGFRLPNELATELNKLAKSLGWNVTDVAQTALDQYVHRERRKGSSEKK